MKYQCIAQLQQKVAGVVSLNDAPRDEKPLRQKLSLAGLCRLREVSRSGYYAARCRARTPEKVCIATAHLKAAFADSGRSYGSRRLRVALADRGIPLSRYRVRKLMRLNQIQPVWKRKFIHTTDSKQAWAACGQQCSGSPIPARRAQSRLGDRHHLYPYP
jgi:hypothetical protein